MGKIHGNDQFFMMLLQYNIAYLSKISLPFLHMNYKHSIIWFSNCKLSHFQCCSVWKFIQTKVTPKLNKSVNIGMYKITVNQWQSIHRLLHTRVWRAGAAHDVVLSLVSHYWSLMKSATLAYIVPVILKWESVLTL